MSNILFIGDPTSIHDHKWASYFAAQNEFNIYFVGEHFPPVESSTKDTLHQFGISFIGTLPSFSLWRLWSTINGILVLRKWIFTYKIDVLHVLFATPYAFWVPFVNIPAVITTRGSDVLAVLPGLKRSKGLRGVHDRLLLRLMRYAMQRASAVTCTSQGQITVLQSLFPQIETPVLVRTGVNVDEIDALTPLPLPVLNTDKKIVFLPRYMRPIYRTEMQIVALSQLPEVMKRNLLVILIEGPKSDANYAKEMQSLLDATALRYKTLQSLTQHEMWSIMKRADLTIMTPITDGTPNTALEAMAARCPLILGNFTYDQTLFGEQYCRRMKRNDASELTFLIQQALDSYIPSMVAAAFENVSLHGDRTVEMQKICNIYQRILTPFPIY